jgi:hypothetical protein
VRKLRTRTLPQPVANEVKAAIKSGVIETTGVCSSCGSDKHVVLHHDDYDRPLDVRELCRRCHIEWHHENGPGANRRMTTMRVEASLSEVIRETAHGLGMNATEYLDALIRVGLSARGIGLPLDEEWPSALGALPRVKRIGIDDGEGER